VCYFSRPAWANDASLGIQTSPRGFVVTVYVVEVCTGPEEVQRLAETTAAELFSRIQVSIRFVHSKPARNDESAVLLRLIERAPYGTRPNVMGAASINPESRLQANVYCDRITAFYRTWNLLESARLTGYVIAHELGHVLQAEPGHSANGIMTAYWRQRDIGAMLRKAVDFLPADGQQIREALAERRETMLRPGVK
jgi:hypothetical protein